MFPPIISNQLISFHVTSASPCVIIPSRKSKRAQSFPPDHLLPALWTAKGHAQQSVRLSRFCPPSYRSPINRPCLSQNRKLIISPSRCGKGSRDKLDNICFRSRGMLSWSESFQLIFLNLKKNQALLRTAQWVGEWLPSCWPTQLVAVVRRLIRWSKVAVTKLGRLTMKSGLRNFPQAPLMILSISAIVWWEMVRKVIVGRKCTISSRLLRRNKEIIRLNDQWIQLAQFPPKMQNSLIISLLKKAIDTYRPTNSII